jgi:hypothetical protein
MAHVTAAVGERAIRESFAALLRSIVVAKADSTDSGAFTAAYDLQFHLENGTIDLRADNTIQISEVDLVWDRLILSLGIDIEKKCVGGGCLGPICIPEVCIFEGDPDVEIEIDLAPLVRQEFSFTGSVLVRYFDASLPPPPWYNPCELLRDALVDLEVLKPPPDHNEWQLFIDPEFADIDLFDFADIVGDLIEERIGDAIAALIPGGPIRDAFLAIIGGIADLIRFVLDIGDDIDEWLSDLFNVSFGLGDFILTLIGDFFGNCVPFFRLEDPYPVLEEEQVEMAGATFTLVPVKIPIRNLTGFVNDVELIVQADVGA